MTEYKKDDQKKKKKTHHNYWNKAVTNLTNSPISPKRKKKNQKTYIPVLPASLINFIVKYEIKFCKQTPPTNLKNNAPGKREVH